MSGIIDGQVLTAAFEAVAAQFYRETGIMAPGKSMAAAEGEHPKSDHRYRQGAWDVWNMMKEKEREDAISGVPETGHD